MVPVRTRALWTAVAGQRTEMRRAAEVEPVEGADAEQLSVRVTPPLPLESRGVLLPRPVPQVAPSLVVVVALRADTVVVQRRLRRGTLAW